MNKKKLFCKVIADAIFRESLFTRADLKGIVRMFQDNKIVQDPEDPISSDEEVKEIKQVLDIPLQPAGTKTRSRTWPWTSDDMQDTLDQLYRTSQKTQYPQKKGYDSVQPFYVPSERIKDPLKGDYDFYNPITEITHIKYHAPTTFTCTHNHSSKTPNTYTTNTLYKVSPIRFERSPYLQLMSENLSVLRGVPNYTETVDKVRNICIDDIEKKAEKSANRMLQAIHPGTPIRCWPEDRKWTC